MPKKIKLNLSDLNVSSFTTTGVKGGTSDTKGVHCKPSQLLACPTIYEASCNCVSVHAPCDTFFGVCMLTNENCTQAVGCQPI